VRGYPYTPISTRVCPPARARQTVFGLHRTVDGSVLAIPFLGWEPAWPGVQSWFPALSRRVSPASLSPALGPARLPQVYPATYTPPVASGAAVLDSSLALVPNCSIHSWFCAAAGSTPTDRTNATAVRPSNRVDIVDLECVGAGFVRCMAMRPAYRRASYLAARRLTLLSGVSVPWRFRWPRTAVVRATGHSQHSCAVAGGPGPRASPFAPGPPAPLSTSPSCASCPARRVP
jgi:hypothetical protein